MPLRIPTTLAVAMTLAACGERDNARISVDARRDAPVVDARHGQPEPDAQDVVSPDAPFDASPDTPDAAADAAVDAYVAVDAPVDAPHV